MIAHRTNTLRHCDLQLVLREGRVWLQAPMQEAMSSASALMPEPALSTC
jgi:ABC-type bacteriocin/lantibiotic exporter with double-glycine peptidase domain